MLGLADGKSMAEQQSSESSRSERAQGEHVSELTRIGGILVGLGLILSAANSQAVKLGGKSMAQQQSPEWSGGERARGEHVSELTNIRGILVGLGLILGAANNQALKLSNQILPELPAPGVLAVRILVGLVGALLLLWGLVGLPGSPLVRGGTWLRTWGRRRRAPKPPAREVGLPPDRNPLFRDREGELERLQLRLRAERRLAPLITSSCGSL